jgi:rhodanese-related sulfurtransferase
MQSTVLKSVLQLLAIAVAAAVCAAVYNAANWAAGSERYLQLEVPPTRYRDALVCNKPSATEKPADPAPGVDTSPAHAAPLSPESPPASAAAEFRFIQIDQAVEEWEAGTLFVDAREAKEYEKGHIPGAVNVPAFGSSREKRVSEIAESEPREAPIVIYCTADEDCPASKEVARDLKALDFANFVIFQGGLPAWEKAGRAIVTGSEPGERPQS